MVYTNDIKVYETGQDQYAISSLLAGILFCVDVDMDSVKPDWPVADWRDSGLPFFRPRHDGAQPIAAAAPDTHERVSAYAWQVECTSGATAFYAQVEAQGDNTEHCLTFDSEEVINWMNRKAEELSGECIDADNEAAYHAQLDAEDDAHWNEQINSAPEAEH